MKKYIFISMTVVGLLACNQGEQTTGKAETDRTRDSLEAIIKQRDSLNNEYLASFNEIERNLDSINIKQKNIYFKTEKPAELKGNIKEEVNAEISAINTLMEKNKKQINNLNHKLRKSDKKNAELENSIKTLNDQLAQKQTELAELNTKLIALNMEIAVLETSVSLLKSENAEQRETIAEETYTLHTAFYVIGTSKDLTKEKLIDRKGGLLGIGKTPELSKDFDAKKFTRIDYTQTAVIPVNSKKIEIITTHPSNSYRLEKENDIVKNVVITNAEQFWGASKYLVVVKND